MSHTIRASVLLLLLTAQLRAVDEGPFAGPFAPAAPASCVAVGDLNLDGLPDLCFGLQDGQLATQLGLGGGAFGEPWLTPIGGAYPGPMQVTELNGDGRPDVVLGSFDFNGPVAALRVFLGSGDGSLVAAGAWPLTPPTTGLRLADLQADGAMDAVLSSSAGSTSVFLGDGHGNFVASSVLPGSSHDADIADLNGDGVLDILTGGPDQSVLVHRGNGAGGFLPHPVSVLVDTEADHVRAGDLDGDDRSELLVGEFGLLKTYFNAGHLAFSPGQSYGGFQFGSATLVDVDEDGDLDAVGQFYAMAVIGLNDGAGMLSFEQRYLGGPEASDFVVADVTGDGDLDLLFAAGQDSEPYGSQMTLLPGRGDGSFVGNLWPEGYVPDGLAAGDFDEDGLDDVALGDLSDNKFRVLGGSGQAGYSLVSEVGSNYVFGPPLTSDVDGDGHLDLLNASNYLYLHLGSGDGALGTKSTVTKKQFALLRQTDLQADGDIDIVAQPYSAAEVRALRNEGNAQFADLLAFSAPGTSRALCVADFSGDGWPDAAIGLVSYATQAGLQVRAGSADGSFGAAVTVPLSGGLGDVEAADIDGDGDIDIAGLGDATTDLFWFSNDGLGHMQVAGPGLATSPAYWIDLQLMDATNDGLIDAVVQAEVAFSEAFHGVLTFAGLGGGLFARPTLTVAPTARPLVASDANGDGALDLLAAYSGLTVLLNRNGPWEDLAHALAGAHGKPRQVGSGNAQPRTHVSLALHDAVRLSPAVQFLGFSEAGVPFKGGVLVPAPDVVNLTLQTDALGQLDIDFALPPWLAPGTSLYLQTWIRDNAAPALWSASNALRLTTP